MHALVDYRSIYITIFFIYSTLKGGLSMYASQVITLIVAGMTMFGVIGFLSLLAHYYTLSSIDCRIKKP
jgi:hypothetical protein